MKFVNSILLLAAVSVYQAHAHSWLACSDYRGSVGPDSTASAFRKDLCQGWPRGWTSNAGFAADIGFDYKGGNCQRPKGTAYSDTYPKAKYVQGGTYRILWPSKNHGFGANLPDSSMKIFAVCGRTADPSLDEWKQNLLIDFKVTPGHGFKNCPAGSKDGNAMCYGDITIPNTLQGDCSFMWYWAFNSLQDLYFTCWDADVVASGDLPPALPTADPPRTQPPTSVAGAGGQTSAPVCASPVSQYGQCGGNGFSGSTCCAEGLRCHAYNPWYSQCLAGSLAEQGADNSADSSQVEPRSGLRSAGIGAAVGLAAGVVIGAAVVAVAIKKARQNAQPNTPNSDGTSFMQL